MVITSPSPNVNDSTSVEPSESVEEPPIRRYKDQEKRQAVKEKAEPGLNPASLSREELCKYSHTVDVAQLAEQLGVDLRYDFPSHSLNDKTLTCYQSWPLQQ